MKTFRFFSSLLLLTGIMVLTSCEKWDILYDCETNEVPGALFPGSPEENIVFDSSGILSTILTSFDTKLTCLIGPKNPTPPLSKKDQFWDTYSFEVLCKDIDYSLDDSCLSFTSKTIPVRVNFIHYILDLIETNELTGKMKIRGSISLDNNDLRQYESGAGDITIYLTLDNGQRIRYRITSSNHDKTWIIRL